MLPCHCYETKPGLRGEALKSITEIQVKHGGAITGLYGRFNI